MQAAWHSLNEDDLLPALMFTALAALACLTPAQNDTWWHLRSGQYMWQTGWFLVTEPFSHTAFGQPLGNHWWLSQLIFYGVFSLGGPFLLSAVAGGCALAAVAGAWKLTKGPWELRVALLAVLVVTTAPEWAVRPQVISLALLVVAAHLVARDRLTWLPVLCAVWANFHGMVVFGVAMGGVILLEALLWSRAHAGRAAAIAAGCVVAPLATPLGWSYWPQVLATVAASRELQIQEYQMPLGLDDLPFWGLLAALLLIVLRHWRRLPEHSRADRILLLGTVVLAVAAAAAARNVAFFAVVAAPALSRLWPVERRMEPARHRRPLGKAAGGLVALAATTGVIVVAVQWRGGGTHLGWRPMSQPAVEAIRRCPDPIFNQLVDGGYLMWALPDRRVFVDSRMEAYPLAVLRASRQADLHGDYQTAFAQYGINCAVVQTGSPLDSTLSRDSGMRQAYSDPARTVFVRRGKDSLSEDIAP